jgi:hypothetical protein
MTSVVTCVAAEARPADVDDALERAWQAADVDWDDFRERAIRGELLPLQLHVSVTATDTEGESFTVDCVNEDVWVDAPDHPPELEEAVRQIAPKDFSTLAARLSEHGVEVTAEALDGMYVTVTLDQSLRLPAERGEEAAAGR